MSSGNSGGDTSRKLVRQATPPRVQGPVIENYGKYEAPPVEQETVIPRAPTELPQQNTMDDQELKNIVGSIVSSSGPILAQATKRKYNKEESSSEEEEVVVRKKKKVRVEDEGEDQQEEEEEEEEVVVVRRKKRRLVV
jgi:hypothetical protein